MCEYRLIETEEFAKRFARIPKDFRKRFMKQLEKVKENPYAVGKPLNKKWFRELKNEQYRLYYIIKEKQIIVILASVSKKKDQQKTIENIKKTYNI